MNPACTAEVATEILNVTLRPPQYFDARITHLQINANVNIGEGEKKHTLGKVG